VSIHQELFVGAIDRVVEHAPVSIDLDPRHVQQRGWTVFGSTPVCWLTVVASTCAFAIAARSRSLPTDAASGVEERPTLLEDVLSRPLCAVQASGRSRLDRRRHVEREATVERPRTDTRCGA
jgi:hypothetical protein